VIHGTVEAADFLGEYIDCTVNVAGNAIRVRAHSTLDLPLGHKLALTLPPSQCTSVPGSA
jgi:hypothetical protein